MIKIYTDNDRFTLYQVKDLFEEANIPFVIKNEFASGAIGETSPMDADVELWITDDAWMQKAQQIVNKFTLEKEKLSNGSEWYCGSCNELNAPQFGICWQCQQPQR